MIHELKVWVEYFNIVAEGIKTFEIRKYDRNYQIGDKLLLREYFKQNDSYTGAYCLVEITYILNEQPFLPEGYICMAIKVLPKT